MSMLKPDYIDLDGDGNKTEPMKEAAKDAKERDGMAIGGVVRVLSSKAKAKLRQELPKRYKSILTPDEAETKISATTADDIIKEYEMGENVIFYDTLMGNETAISAESIEEILGKNLLKSSESQVKRKSKQEGGLLEDDREQYVVGGLASRLAGLISRKSKLEKELRTENMSKANQNKTSKEIKVTDEQIEKLQKQIDEGNTLEGVSSEAAADLQREMSEVASQLKARGFSDERIDEILEEAFELRNYSELEEALSRTPKQEGGEMDEQMSMLMKKEQEPPMESDEEMEDNYLDFIIDEALTEEEEDMLMSKLQQDEQLSMLFDKVIEVASEFAGSGPVEGPGSGVSDSIPARLSDGEFVFTAKAVEEIGADELMRMMKDAEMKADERQGMANGGEMDEEENVVVRDVDEPVTQNINVTKTTVDSPAKGIEDEDELTKSIRTNMMMRKSPDHVRS